MASDINELKRRYESDQKGITDYSQILTGDEALRQQAYQNWFLTFDKYPTQKELDTTLRYAGGSTQGILNYIDSIYNSPDNVYKRQQEEYQKGAPDKFSDVGSAFKGLLGRDATQEELDHFGKLLSSGQVDQYQLQEFLKQEPEYVQKQDAQFREGLSGELSGYDKQYLEEQALPAIQSAYAKQGRSFEGSGFKQAVANTAGAQNIERQKYLAGLSASQYAGRQGNARSDYENYVQQLQGRQTAQLTEPYARQRQLMDYGIQKSAYEDYLRRYGKQNSSNGYAGAASGAVGGAMAGSVFGPWGTGIGAVVGGGLGYFGSQG